MPATDAKDSKLGNDGMVVPHYPDAFSVVPCCGWDSQRIGMPTALNVIGRSRTIRQYIDKDSYAHPKHDADDADMRPLLNPLALRYNHRLCADP